MPLQTHIRSPLLTAAPISRLRRARAQEGGTILFFGFLSQAKFRSAHLDPPEPIRPQKIEKGKSFRLADGVRALRATVCALAVMPRIRAVERLVAEWEVG